MKYQEAYNKIIDAYFKDEIKPLDSSFCFCGTLSPNGRKWDGIWGFSFGKDKDEYHAYKYSTYEPYTLSEYKRMEWALIDGKNRIEGLNDSYEDNLFVGMSRALDVLKQIHIERGEVIDETPVFTKRQLA